MTELIEHDGGPQPVADDVWVGFEKDPDFNTAWRARFVAWHKQVSYRVLNQHLIDAARLEGIRLGLEAAAEEADAGRRPSMDWCDHIAKDIRALDPATIAKEADQ